MSWGLRGKLIALVRAYRAKQRNNIELATAYDKEGGGGKEHATKFRRIAHIVESVADDIDRIIDKDIKSSAKLYVGIDYGVYDSSTTFTVYCDEAGVLMYGDTLIQAFDGFCEALESQIEALVEPPKDSVYPGRKTMSVREKLLNFPKQLIFDEPTKKFYSGGSIMEHYIPGHKDQCPHCGKSRSEVPEYGD